MTSSAFKVPNRLRGRLFLKVADVAVVTDSDPRTVRRAIELEQIPAIRLGDSTIRIPAAPFWRLCGIDPETTEDAEGGSSTEPPTATIHAFEPPKTGAPHGAQRRHLTSTDAPGPADHGERARPSRPRA